MEYETVLTSPNIRVSSRVRCDANTTKKYRVASSIITLNRLCILNFPMVECNAV